MELQKLAFLLQTLAVQSDGGSSVSNVVVILRESVTKVADLESPFGFLVIQLEELVEIRTAELRLFGGDKKSNFIRHVTLAYQTFGLQHYQSFQNVPQLANVARIGVLSQPSKSGGLELRDGSTVLFGGHLQEVADQRRNIARPPSQGWNVDLDNLQTVVEILSELSFSNQHRKILVGCAENPNIHRNGLSSSQPLDQPVFQNPQNIGLGFGRHVSNLIQKESPVPCLLEFADPLAGRPRKSPFLVAEEFTFNQVGRDGSAVDTHQGTFFPSTASMDFAGHQLFPAAAFSRQEYGHTRLSDALDQTVNLSNRLTRPDQFSVAGGECQLGSKAPVLAPQLEVVLHRTNQQSKLIDIKGLGQIVEGPFFHCLDSSALIAVGCNDNDIGPWIAELNLLEQIEPLF